MERDLDDVIRRSIARRAEAAVMGALSSTLTTAAAVAPKEPLTLDTLRRMMAGMPKPDYWLSTRLFPAGETAMRVEGSEGNFLVAHPSLWLRLRHHLERDMAPNMLSEPRPIFGIQIVEIDYDCDDDPARRRYLASLWRKLRDAVEVAMVPLPEWLCRAPAFSEHG